MPGPLLPHCSRHSAAPSAKSRSMSGLAKCGRSGSNQAVRSISTVQPADRPAAPSGTNTACRRRHWEPEPNAAGCRAVQRSWRQQHQRLPVGLGGFAGPVRFGQRAGQQAPQRIGAVVVQVEEAQVPVVVSRHLEPAAPAHRPTGCRQVRAGVGDRGVPSGLLDGLQRDHGQAPPQFAAPATAARRRPPVRIAACNGSGDSTPPRPCRAARRSTTTTSG